MIDTKPIEKEIEILEGMTEYEQLMSKDNTKYILICFIAMSLITIFSNIAITLYLSEGMSDRVIEKVDTRIIAEIKDKDCIKTVYTSESQYLDPVSKIMFVGREYALNHDYDNETYNCKQFSNGLRNVFNELGIASRRVSGKSGDGNIAHRWLKVELDFEPTSGKFVDYSDEYEIYKEWEEYGS